MYYIVTKMAIYLNMKKFIFFLLCLNSLSADIIYLNGPSSSGKTTLSWALQGALPEPYLYMGIDQIIRSVPIRLNDAGTASDGFAWLPSTDPTGHPTYEVYAGPFAKKVIRTFKEMALFLDSQGYNLIIDDVSFGAEDVNEWKEVLKDCKVLYVGVHAPLEILEERERARGDRVIGCARGMYSTVHQAPAYDLEIDTHVQTVEENVAKIQKALK